MSIQDVSAITSSIEMATLQRFELPGRLLHQAVSRPASMLLISTVSLPDAACVGKPETQAVDECGISKIATGKGTTSSTGERRS